MRWGLAAAQYAFKIGEWGKCSHTCDAGTRKRTIECLSTNGELGSMSSCAGKLPIVSEECPSLPRCGKTQKVLGLPHRVYTTFRAACFSRTRQGNWSHCRFKGSHAPLCVCASACHRPDRPRLVLSEIGIDPTQQMLCHAAFLWCSCFVVQLFCRISRGTGVRARVRATRQIGQRHGHAKSYARI